MFGFNSKKVEFRLSNEQQALLDSATSQASIEQDRFVILRVEPYFYRSLTKSYDEFDEFYAADADVSLILGLVSGYEAALEASVEDLMLESKTAMLGYWEFASVLERSDELGKMVHDRIESVKEHVRIRAVTAFGEYLRAVHPGKFAEITQANP